MLEYSPEAAYIKSEFLSYRNDILIFTEDNEKDREFYVCLFSRLIDGAATINDIIPLGKRKDVVDTCRGERSGITPEVYIIDSDIDIINGGVEESHEDLYPLPFYCCENLLFEENAILELAYLDCGTKEKAVLLDEMRFADSVIEDFPLFFELFLHFAICRICKLPFSLRGYEGYLVSQKCGTIDTIKVQHDIDCLRYMIDICRGSRFYDERIDILRKQWPLTSSSITTVISGKDYLIPYAKRMCSRVSGKRIFHSKESLKLRLVSHCNLDQLIPLREMILAKTHGKIAS